jgi:hypothetical protein
VGGAGRGLQRHVGTFNLLVSVLVFFSGVRPGGSFKLLLFFSVIYSCFRLELETLELSCAVTDLIF